jgi:neural Wiskott-Aldrich syndrome protein
MTQDHNKKTLRQFQCRDYLWEIFEQMGAELECSTDYLVNEAMRQYARSRNWGAQSNAASAASAGAAVAAPAPPPLAAVQPPPRPSMASGGAPPLPQSPRMPAPAGGGIPPVVSRAARPAATSGSNAAVRPPGATVPPPLPGGGQQAAHRGDMPSLFVIFNGQKVPVNKEEFVIGRGSKTADLPIKDGNISRRHAAIVLQNGAFYMKDLGSTNGIEFNGERVDSRRIEEGDVYQLCDYELRFTYH